MAPTSGSFAQSLRGDLRFAFRYFARHRATTAIIVAVLALGTGANAAIFSLFQAQFVRPAPAVPADPAHVRIWSEERSTPTAQSEPRAFAGPELRVLAERREVFGSVSAWVEDAVVIGGGDSTGARSASAQFVSANYFTTLGVPLTAGRGLIEGSDDQPDHSAVISHLAARRLYGEASRAVGRTILVNEVPVEIVGVAPPRFQGALKNMDEPALFLPLGARSDITGLDRRWLTDDPSLTIIARVAPGASLEQATAVARQVVTNLLPDSAARVGLTRTAEVVKLYDPLPGAAGENMVFAFTIVFSIGVLILLVACMNVSSLMVASAVSRRHEIAVRLALGASRARLVRQMVTESTLLAVVGGVIGLILAYWMLWWNVRTEIDGYEVMPDLGTFAFVLMMAVATGILFGLSPAVNATRGGVASAMRDSGGGSSHRSRLQRGLVVAQIAASQPLLVLLGVTLMLVIKEYRPLDPMMSREVISAVFSPLDSTPSTTMGPAAVEQLMTRIAERPEVLSVVPAADGVEIRGIFALDAEGKQISSDTTPTVMHLQGAAPGWFATLQVPILLGRDVALADTASSDRPVVIGADLARALWGDVSPIGRRLASPVLGGFVQDSVMMTVVGVFDPTRRVPGMTFQGENGVSNIPYSFYTAHGKRWRHDRLLIRTRGPALAQLHDLQRFVIAEAPSLPLISMRSLAQMDEMDYVEAMKISAVASAGGLLALLLASLGLYGVIALAVRQRTREIGIRIAVGANPVRVALMFLASGVKSSVLALAIGLPLSIAGLKLAMSGGLVIAPGVDPFLIGGVIAVLLIAVASAATWIPARRAAQVDPATALRVE